MLTAFYVHVSRTFLEWRRRNRSRRELTMLGPIELSDFSCTAGDAAFETRKWFWQR